MRWLFIFCIIPVLSNAQQNAVLQQYHRHIVEALAHDSMQGRLPGTPAEANAAAFILTGLKKAGCVPVKGKSYLQPFTYTNPDSVLVQSTGNVIACVNPKAKKTVVVGAHYDHLGMGRHHSRAPFSNAIHNGADDNASGVAMLLSLAQWCATHKTQLKYRMVFVAYSGEEDGLWGSQHLLGSKLLDTAAIALYINLDMVGHLNTTTPILKTEGLVEHPELDTLLMADSLAGFNVRKADPVFTGGSDNYTFETHHIPGLSFSTGLTEQYHKPEDDVALINFEGMQQIHRYLLHVLQKLNGIAPVPNQ